MTTITTVQASSGVYLTPEAELTLPAFVERRRTPAVVGDESRSQVDAALLFRGSAPVGLQLDATLSPALSGQNPWSLEWVYPRLEAQTAGLLWRLHVDANAPATEDAQASSEWSGWNVFGGLGVRPASDAAASLPSAPAALVNFSARGPFAPLELRSESTSLIVSNPSPRAVTQALLIYSHSSGVGVRDVRNLGPGERRVTALGPKERAPTELLASAQAMLTAFFAERVGADLAATIAASKSIPFLETPGLRLVYLLDEVDSPFALEFSPHVARARRVLVAHAEVLSSFDEANALALLANDPTLDSKSASAALGRFTEAKLELAVSNGNPEVSARAAALLSDLRAQ